MIQESSFDSLPPGEKYHMPPNESHSSREVSQENTENIQNIQNEEQAADGSDPFDTSGIIIPEPASLKDQTPEITLESSETATGHDTSMTDHAGRNSNLPPMLAQIAAFMSPPHGKLKCGKI